MDRYPVDDINKKTNYEMYVPMKNISMKVAVGYVLPSGPEQLRHGREIRAGYARVGVDAIVLGYESLELDVAGPEEEATLGEVLGGVILWDKKHIVFLGSAPRRPPSPPSPRNSPPPNDDRDDYHTRVHIDLRLNVSHLRRLCPLVSPRVMASLLLCPLAMPL
jgi:hypothetical protein